MGIRVRKFLGWGLTDLEPGEKGHGQADSRVNWDSPLLGWDSAESAPRAYYEWLEGRRLALGERFSFSLDWAMLRHTDSRPGDSLRDSVAYDPEYGLPEVLALRPVAKTDWSRYDDDIDYMTETYPWREDSQTSHVQVFDHPPFPFNGADMDSRDGRKLPDLVLPWWQLMHRRETPGSAETGFALGALDRLAREMGFAGQDEAKSCVIPLIPEEIRDLAGYGALFTGPDVWLQLRPLLYTWWA
jgi:hypothetical protein